MTRTYNSIKNITISWVSQLILILSKFVMQTALVRLLTQEYIGLNGLFANILSVLSLAELGIGTAIVYSLYKPIAEDDSPSIIALMMFFKKAYILIGSIIIILGLSLVPFLDFFIREMPDIPNVRLIYILFVFNSAITYFFSYKSSFVIATQKSYIVNINHSLFALVLTTTQILVLYITRNYVLSLLVQFIVLVFENISIVKIANKKYEVLKSKHKYRLERNLKKQLIKNTGAMIFHKIGSIVVLSTDNIILSKFIGLGVVAQYSNYLLITTAVDRVISQMFKSITPSIGNLGVTANRDKQIEIFDIIFLVNFWIVISVTIILFNILNPFIEMWFGEIYLLDKKIFAVILLNYYLFQMRKSVNTFKEALGLFWNDRYKPLFEAITNLVFSILLVQVLGTIGVFIGTTISTLATVFWIEPYVLYKYGFEESVGRYFSKYSKFTGIGIVLIILTTILCNLVTFSGWLGLGAKLLISVIAPNIILLLLLKNTNEVKYLFTTFTNLIPKKK